MLSRAAKPLSGADPRLSNLAHSFTRWLRRRTQAAGMVLLLACTAGCGRISADTTQAGLQQGLKEMLSRQQACVIVGKLPARPMAFAAHLQHFDILVKLGLLEVSEVPHPSPFGGSSPAGTDKEYRLTAKGEQFARPDRVQDGYDVCYGKPGLVSILRFTQPGPAYDGKVSAEVTYTYQLTEVAAWAKSPEFRGIVSLSRLLADLDSPQQRHVTLVQTNNGWYSDERWPAYPL